MPQGLAQIKSLLAEQGVRPRRRLGQSFLHDAQKLQHIVELARPLEGRTVLEVGPGTGALTELLLEEGAEVIGVELDPELCALLRRRLGTHPRFTLLEGDALAGKHSLGPDLAQRLAGAGPFALVANLPFQIASPLLAILARAHPAMESAVVTVQREVGERIAATPGGKAYGPLGIMIQAMCTVRIAAQMPAACFWPVPKVDSSVICLVRRAVPLAADPAALAAICHTLFSKRRKQIGTILGRNSLLPQGVLPTMRPEQLSVEQLVALAERPK